MAGRILIVDPATSQRVMLKSRLADAYYQVDAFADPSDPLIPVRAAQADLVFLAAEPFGSAARALMGKLKSGRRTGAIPVILILRGEQMAVATALGRGADDVLVDPFSDIALHARVQALVRVKRMHDELMLRDSTARAFGFGELPVNPIPPPDALQALHFRPVPRGLDDPAPRIANCMRLTCEEVATEVEILRRCGLNPAALVLLQMTGRRAIEAGFRIIGRLRAEPETRQTAVVMIIEPDAEAVAARGLDLGANDFVTIKTARDELVARLSNQARRFRLNQELRDNLATGLRDAVTDPLTRVMNRRYATLHIPQLITQARASGHDFALMLLDLDRFKQINDNYGHPAGDRILIETANRMQQSVRGVDLISRYGGEEFLIALPDAPRSEAWCIAERVRDAIAESPIPTAEGKADAIRVTASVGVSVTTPSCSETFEDMVAHADQALYQAKRSGRNRVSISATAAA